MSESSQPTKRDPVRIVYHAGNRTFARLFNERSLGEVKDVVRRKLGLGRETDVLLEQMTGFDAHLDLEDDDDFQAFCVFIKSSVSVDIRVTVGKSQGSAVLPPASPKHQKQPSTSEPTTTTTTTSSASPSGKPAGVAASSRPITHPEVPRTTEVSTPTAKIPKPLARKRKVSLGDATQAGSNKPVERPALTQSVALTPIASAKTAESPATAKLVGAEEPPKKKQKKEPTKTKMKTKDVQTTEAVESPTTKASGVTKTKAKKSTVLDSGGKAVPKDAETSEPPARKLKKPKKVDSTSPKKSSAPVDQDGMDQSVSQSVIPVNEASLQPAAEKITGSRVEDGASKTRKSETTKALIGVCASIPQTSASTSVQSEVAAAILSRYLSKTIPPEPPAKRKSVKRVTKKSSASSSPPPVEPTTLLDASANEAPNVPTGHRLKQVVLTNEPPQRTLDLNGPPCPICLEEPFHIRYCCPTVLKGPDAIRERLEELKRTNTGDQQSLIKQLESLLRDSKVISKPSLDAAPTDSVQSRKALPSPNASLPRTPDIPSNSYLSEVTVESRDEGSSSESSDDISGGGAKQQDSPAPRRQKTPDEQLTLSNDDLEAVIRGPASKRQSILQFLDRIVNDEDDQDADSEEVEAELEEDPDEGTGRSSQHTTRSSDSESEEDSSRSPSPSRLATSTSNNSGPGALVPNKPVEDFTEHQDGDVVMRDSVYYSVLEGQDDNSSEKSHAGSEDHMVMDESIGERGTTIIEEQPSSPASNASILPPSDASGNEPQESEKTEVDPTPNRDGNVPVASEVLEEVAADPIEPAEDLEPSTASRLSKADPIEVPSEDIGSLFASMTQSTPEAGVSKRIKTRNGRILDDEADRPVLLEQLAPQATDKMTPVSAMGRSRRMVTETPSSQELAPTRRSPRFSSLPPSTSTPAAVVLLKHRSKVGTRASKTAKTPAKQPEGRSDASQSSAKDNAARNGTRITSTPSLIRWETLAEPSSPFQQPDEASVLIDELMSSSPQPDDNPIPGRLNNKVKRGIPRKSVSSSQAEISRGKERLFDPSSSQIPFPYSQTRINLVPTTFPNGKECEGITDSEEEPKETKKNAKAPAGYRPLSQLASQATLFSPSLPTPANKSGTNGKAKIRSTDEDPSSSSSSDADEANGLRHIPRGRRAGSVLETKKRKSMI